MKIAVSSVCSDDYFQKYKKCIDSQICYCKKFGYDFIKNSDSSDIHSKQDWYWKKINVVKNLFNFYEVVVIIDADCEIKNNAPPLESIIDSNSIYYVLGISRRPNSGFLIIKNDLRGKEFITDVLLKRNLFPPNHCRAPGENGHVIWSLEENSNLCKELPIEWNCSQLEYRNKAYIVHYTNELQEYYKEN